MIEKVVTFDENGVAEVGTRHGVLRIEGNGNFTFLATSDLEYVNGSYDTKNDRVIELYNSENKLVIIEIKRLPEEQCERRYCFALNIFEICAKDLFDKRLTEIKPKYEYIIRVK